MNCVNEAKKWLDQARRERGTKILEAVSNLEKILYKSKINPSDIGTSYAEIRKLKENECKQECYRCLVVLRRKNSARAINELEKNRLKGKFSYADIGTSHSEIARRKIMASLNPRWV